MSHHFVAHHSVATKGTVLTAHRDLDNHEANFPDEGLGASNVARKLCCGTAVRTALPCAVLLSAALRCAVLTCVGLCTHARCSAHALHCAMRARAARAAGAAPPGLEDWPCNCPKYSISHTRIHLMLLHISYSHAIKFLKVVHTLTYSSILVHLCSTFVFYCCWAAALP